MEKLRKWLVDLKTYIVKMVILPKLIYRFSTIPVRIPPDFFAKTDKLILKFTGNCKGSKKVETILKRKTK